MDGKCELCILFGDDNLIREIVRHLSQQVGGVGVYFGNHDNFGNV